MSTINNEHTVFDSSVTKEPEIIPERFVSLILIGTGLATVPGFVAVIYCDVGSASGTGHNPFNYACNLCYDVVVVDHIKDIGTYHVDLVTGVDVVKHGVIAVPVYVVGLIERVIWQVILIRNSGADVIGVTTATIVEDSRSG